MMRMNKAKRGVVVGISLSLYIAGAGLAALQTLVAQQPGETKSAPKSKAEKPKPAERAAPKPTRDLVVRVTDGDGKPVSDAEVHLLVGMSPVVAGQTNGDGRWAGRVPADDAKRWSVFARKSKVGFDYATAERSPGSQKELRPLPQQLTLKLDGARTVRIKTVDGQGKPIAGIKVGPWFIHKPGREANVNLSGTSAFWPTTDKDGVAVLDWLPKRFEQNLPIMTWTDDYYAIDRFIIVRADKPDAELTIPHLPMERLSGRVTHAKDRPAVGITVSAFGRGTGSNEFRNSVKTDADGRYTMKVYSEQVYILVVGDDKWAAPYRSGVLVRAGEPATNKDFIVRRATRLHGRVTVGKDECPASQKYLVLTFGAGEVPPGLRRKKDSYHFLVTSMETYTDKDGRFEFHLGPGTYMLNGPERTKSVRVTISPLNPPAEIVQDFQLP